MITAMVNILGCIFESIIIFMLFDAYIDKTENVHTYKKIVSVGLLALLIIISNAVLKLGLVNLIFVVCSIFSIMYVHCKNIKINLILSIISVVILSISEIIVALLIVRLTGVSISQIEDMQSYYILGSILSKLIAFFVIKFFCVVHNKDNDLTIKTSYWILFLIMFITSGLSIFLIFRFQNESVIIELNTISVICSFGLLYTTYFALYLYENLSFKTKLEQRQEFFQKQIKSQAKHLDEILISQRQVKKVRHDLSNHSILLRKFLENKDYDSALRYLVKLDELAIVSSEEISTGNAALDAIINTKKNIAKNKNIKFIINIQIPENIFVDAIDICMIFGNALDNCIEACEKVKETERWISVSIVYDDDSLIAKISNSSVKNKNQFLYTTKPDKSNHGFGIENIESALAKYKHISRFEEKESEFHLSFIIFND